MLSVHWGSFALGAIALVGASVTALLGVVLIGARRRRGRGPASAPGPATGETWVVVSIIRREDPPPPPEHRFAQLDPRRN